MLSPYVLGQFLNRIAKTQDTWFSEPQYGAIAMMALTGLTRLIWYAKTTLDKCVLPSLRTQVITMGFAHILQQPFPYFTRQRLRTLGPQIQDLAESTVILYSACSYVVLYAASLFGVLCISAMVHWLFVCLFLSMAASLIGLSCYVTPPLVQLSGEASAARTELYSVVIDSITHIVDVVVNYAQADEQQRVAQIAERAQLHDCAFRYRGLQNLWVLGLVAGVLEAVILMCILNLAQRGALSVGLCATLLVLSLRVVDLSWLLAEYIPVFAKQLGIIQHALQGLSPMLAIGTSCPSASDSLRSHPRGAIDLDRVSFRLGGRQLIHQLRCHIPAGAKVGVMGASGAGKSTLAYLIMGLYSPHSGVIRVDGVPLHMLDSASIHHVMAYVPQKPALLARTVLDNILLGQKNICRTAIINMAKRLHAHEFIMQLPQGYDTQVGVGGVLLSGGQIQRLALVRALLRSPRILIVDEATSALDNETEQQVLQAIMQTMQGKTLIMITHQRRHWPMLDRVFNVDTGFWMNLGCGFRSTQLL
jgi:ABC-type bacteriocin/lantibiotic exporter with double-glycine peptidase domain